ncbi:unnamed protein product [Mytilus coruscus]|uniref:C2H2-type domain-containing protein n=1 Tax=Mytilus coruscus TaxID=42192 RepID=A0A6J8DI68_MYTCO|nr:unnamed protein product [Mytilus coruscus]
MPSAVSSKLFHHVLMTSAIGLHGRNQEMSMVQFMTGFLLTHGGCTQRNIERLSHIGLSVHPVTIHRKLAEWQKFLDKTILAIKEEWEKGGNQKYQLIGDNLDKNILPSYRTSDRKTVSLHLFNIFAIVDRVQPVSLVMEENLQSDLSVLDFLPSVEEQVKLKKELIFIISTSIINCHPQMKKIFQNIFPKHLEHRYTEYAAVRTKQPDIFIKCKDVVGDPEYPDSYWVSTLEDSRVTCHFCEKTYAYVGSLKTHEAKVHNSKIELPKKPTKEKKQDELQNYILMLFKLILLHRNLDTAVDMGDGERVGHSAKYELPVYNLTNKIKYLIGSVHLTALTSGVLPPDQSERLIAYRFVNLQGGTNNNISLDEYLKDVEQGYKSNMFRNIRQRKVSFNTLKSILT